MGLELRDDGSASARMWLLSSEGWKAKSKSAHIHGDRLKNAKSPLISNETVFAPRGLNRELRS